MSARCKNILAMVSFGTLSLFVRPIGLSSLEIAFWRGAIALAILWPLKALSGHKSALLWGQKGLLFVSGMAIGLNWVLLFQAYTYTSVATATLAYYFAPVLVMAVSPFLFHEKMTRFQGLCFAMATLGLVLVIRPGGAGASHTLGILCGLGAAVFYAGVVLMNKALRSGSGLERTCYQFLGAATLLFVVLMGRGGFAIQSASFSGVIHLLIVGVFHTGVCYWLYFTSLKDLPGQQAALLSYLDPLVAIAVSVVFFHEPMGALQIAGALLILGFTCLYELRTQRPRLAGRTES